MIYCPRCGTELKVYQEHMGYRWLYRMYPCSVCKVIWDWKSLIKKKVGEDNRWILEECRAWKAVGLPILDEQAEGKLKHSTDNI